MGAVSLTRLPQPERRAVSRSTWDESGRIDPKWNVKKHFRCCGSERRAPVVIGAWRVAIPGADDHLVAEGVACSASAPAGLTPKNRSASLHQSADGQWTSS